MPFTPSHAVVALPFVRTALSPAAVAVGAMAPDVPLFVRGTPLDYATTHDIRWLPLTVVAALVLLLVWRMLLRPAVRELSPLPLAARFPAAWDAGAAEGLRETFVHRGGARPSGAGAALLLVGLAIGVVSHLVWDAFTHEDRWGSAWFPAVAEQWGPLPGYRWLQYGSSAFGLVALAVWALLWLRARAASPESVHRVLPRAARVLWWVSLPLALVLGAVLGVVAFGLAGGGDAVTRVVYRALVPAVAAWGIVTLVVAAVVQSARRRAHR